LRLNAHADDLECSLQGPQDAYAATEAPDQLPVFFQMPITIQRNLIANYLGQFWVALMNLAFVPIYIRFLGMEAFGLIGFFAVMQTWLGLLNMGLTPMLAREMARFTGGARSNESTRDLLRSVETLAIVVSTLTAGCVALSATWIATSWLKVEILGNEVVAQAFAIMGLVVSLRIIESVYRSAIIGLQRQVLFNIINSIMATVRSFGAVIALAFVTPSIQVFFLWQGLVSVATIFVLAFATYAILPHARRTARFSFEAIRNVWRFAGGMLGITFLAVLLTQVDKLLLSTLLTLSTFGFYMLASAVAGALFMLIEPVTQAFYPKLCEMHARGDASGLASNFHKGAQFVTVIAGSAALVLIFFSENVLRLWTQDADLAKQTALLLSLLVFGNLLNGLMWIPYQTQLAHGWTRLTFCVNVVAVTAIIPLLFWVVPRFGAVGAAWVWIGLNSGYILIAAHFMYRRILVGEKSRWYWNDVIIPLAFGGLVALLISVIWPSDYSIASDVAVVLVASILTVSATLITAAASRQLLLELVLRYIKRRAPTHGH
jgi:O-antigen/teichoic acid export membrane protein